MCRNADSVIHDGESLKFVKPLEVEQRFDAFIDGVVAQESTPGDRLGPVQYAQSRKHCVWRLDMTVENESDI